MSANFTIQTETIKFSGGTFTVRGINTEDFTLLSQDYIEDLKLAVSRHATPSGRIRPDKKADVILDVASHFPKMAAEIISRCAEAPEMIDQFRQLPIMVTVRALDQIFRLTMQDGGPELGKAAAGLASILEVNGLKLGPLANRLKATIETAANTSHTSSTTATSTPDDTLSES